MPARPDPREARVGITSLQNLQPALLRPRMWETFLLCVTMVGAAWRRLSQDACGFPVDYLWKTPAPRGTVSEDFESKGDSGIRGRCFATRGVRTVTTKSWPSRRILMRSLAKFEVAEHGAARMMSDVDKCSSSSDDRLCLTPELRARLGDKESKSTWRSRGSIVSSCLTSRASARPNAGCKMRGEPATPTNPPRKINAPLSVAGDHAGGDRRRQSNDTP